MKTLKTLQEEIVREFDRECTNSHPGDSGIGGNCPQEPIYEWACEPNDVKKWLEQKLTTLTTAIIEQSVEKIEAGKEEVRYGMDTMYGDTDHPHPSVIFGKNEAKDEDIAILRSFTNK